MTTMARGKEEMLRDNAPTVVPAPTDSGSTALTTDTVAPNKQQQMGNVSPSLLAGHLESRSRNHCPLETLEDQQQHDFDEDSDIISTTVDIPSRSPPPKQSNKSCSSNRKRSKKKSTSKPTLLERRKPNSTGKNVHFDKVIVREYARCTGDNPSVGSGPPVGLGWEYLPGVEFELELFETSVRLAGHRTRNDFLLTPQTRFHMLLDEWGFSAQEISLAEDEASEIRHYRQVSVFGPGGPLCNNKNAGGGGGNSRSSKSVGGGGGGQQSPPSPIKGKKKSSSSSRVYKLPPMPPSPTQGQERWNASPTPIPLQAS
jgi:hypothetical protein